jgi:hypothetical protein
MLRRIVLIFLFFHIVITLATGWLYGYEFAKAAFIGATLMLFNIAVIAWVWRRIFVKKSIALTVSVIVGKYAIIGIAVYWLVVKSSMNVIGFLTGAIAIVIALFVAAVDSHRKSLRS